MFRNIKSYIANDLYKLLHNTITSVQMKNNISIC